MTEKQAKTVEWLRKEIIRHDGYGKHADKYEYKTFEVEEIGYGIVTVYSVVGLKGDEGTMAAILCRTTRHIAIGPRGGMKLLNSRKGTVTGRKVTWALTN